MSRIFSPTEAFKRSLGWITPVEAEKLAKTRVAIAGVGGVGGQYCEVLARLGVGAFHIADPDHFEIANFNRQNGAGMSTIGRMKVDVLRERILDINPSADVKVFNAGINEGNMDEFLTGVDLYLDGLDFFLLNERISLFKKLQKKGIPGITVAPIAMGAAALVFTKDSMSFEDYFGMFVGQNDDEQRMRFLLGLAPSLMHVSYLVDRSYVDMTGKRAPSLPTGPYLCAGVASSLATKILLGRGPLKLAPWSLHYDAYLNKYKKTYVWLGFKNPLQKLKLMILKRFAKQITSKDK